MKQKLDELVSDGVLTAQRHTYAPLTIYNYTRRCAYERLWDDHTLQARGLILDDAGKIVARGFRKFFNLGEIQEPLPTCEFKVLDKLDGSLGILYFVHGQPAISTRGSFASEQAKWATSHFLDKYRSYVPPQGTTAVFEIIYPGNRIVVDYGQREDLVALGLVDNATGNPLPFRDQNWPGPEAGEFTAMTPEELKKHVRPNAEGYVIRFSNGFQVKVKLEEYVRLHKIVFQTSSRSIWENLSEGMTPEQIRESTPKDLLPFVDRWLFNLTCLFDQCKSYAESMFLIAPKGSRKDFAEFAVKTARPAVLFAMLDGKDFARIIWKEIEPQWIPAKVMPADEAPSPQ